MTDYSKPIDAWCPLCKRGWGLFVQDGKCPAHRNQFLTDLIPVFSEVPEGEREEASPPRMGDVVTTAGRSYGASLGSGSPRAAVRVDGGWEPTAYAMTADDVALTEAQAILWVVEGWLP